MKLRAGPKSIERSIRQQEKLSDDFIKNAQHARKIGEDLHRPVPANLEQILCRQEPRTVGRDWCVAWDGRVLQIDAAHAPLKLPGRRITVRHLRDGRLLLEHQGHRLTFVELPARPTPAKPKKVIVNNKPSKPAPTHPWGWHVGHVASERRRGDTSTSA